MSKSVIKVSNKFRQDNCPLCGSSKFKTIGRIKYLEPTYFSSHEVGTEFTSELCKCIECDSAFAQNILPEQLAVSLYSSGISANRWSQEAFVSQKPQIIIDSLTKYFIKGRAVLDVGSNTGELLDFAKAKGCVTYGVEYSQVSREILKEKNHRAFASMTEVEQKFDVITAFDLIEHLYDVPSFLLECRQHLKDDGVLIILTGNINSFSAMLSQSRWWYVGYPEHIIFPSKKYFIQFSGLLLVEYVHTFVSKGYQVSWGRRFKALLSGLLKWSYTGLPAIDSDHTLVVLKK